MTSAKIFTSTPLSVNSSSATAVAVMMSKQEITKAEREPERVVLNLYPWVVTTTHGSENHHGIVACITDTNIVDEWEVW